MPQSSILVVERERNLRTFYKIDLERDGHSVLTAADAGEAARLLRSRAPNLVVLNVPMPSGRGFGDLRAMLDRHLEIPVVMNCGCASYRENLLERAADAYVVKSADTRELRMTILGLLARSAGGGGGAKAA